jgi:hypothetical protein
MSCNVAFRSHWESIPFPYARVDDDPRIAALAPI